VYIPERMAYTLVASASPDHGLYAGIIPSIIAGLLAGSAFMVVTPTNGMALMTVDTLSSTAEVTTVISF
jgi:SulP family sulfate permease